MNEKEFDELMYNFYLFTQVLDVFGIDKEEVFEEDVLLDSYKDNIGFNVSKYMYEQIKKPYTVRTETLQIIADNEVIETLTFINGIETQSRKETD